MNKSQPASFRQWLSIATDSLPEQVIQIVVPEFENHYLDAIDDLLEEGLSPKEAQIQVLTNLGQAETISRCLKDVHLGRRQYKVAAVASLLILVVLLFSPVFVENFLAGRPVTVQAVYILTGVVLAALTAYVLNTTRRLLIWRFALQKLDRLFKMAIASYLLWLAADIISLASHNAPLYIGSLRAMREAVNGFDKFLIAAAWLAADIISLASYNAPLYIGSLRAMHEAVSGFDKLLIATAWLGQIGLGATGMMISTFIWQSQDGLYSIGKPLAVCLALMAVPIGLAGLAVNLGLSMLVSILTTFVILGHVLIWPVISLLFVRAIFRPPNAQPPQLV